MGQYNFLLQFKSILKEISGTKLYIKLFTRVLLIKKKQDNVSAW